MFGFNIGRFVGSINLRMISFAVVDANSKELADMASHLLEMGIGQIHHSIGIGGEPI
jgi:hypothetical protein